MTKNTSLILHEHAAPCRVALQALVSSGSVDAAVLCSVDGLPITHITCLDIPEDAISAMTASLMALADAMVGQMGEQGSCRQVVIESVGRTVVLVHAGNNMALAVAGQSGMNIGMVIGHAKRTVEQILDILSLPKAIEESRPSPKPATSSMDELIKRVMIEVEESKL